MYLSRSILYRCILHVIAKPSPELEWYTKAPELYNCDYHHGTECFFCCWCRLDHYDNDHDPDGNSDDQHETT